MAFEPQLLCLFFIMGLSNHVSINFNLDNLDSSLSPEDTNNGRLNETFEIQPKILDITPRMGGNANRTLESETPPCFLKSEGAR